MYVACKTGVPVGEKLSTHANNRPACPYLRVCRPGSLPKFPKLPGLGFAASIVLPAHRELDQTHHGHDREQDYRSLSPNLLESDDIGTQPNEIPRGFK